MMGCSFCSWHSLFERVLVAYAHKAHGSDGDIGRTHALTWMVGEGRGGVTRPGGVVQLTTRLCCRVWAWDSGAHQKAPERLTKFPREGSHRSEWALGTSPALPPATSF